MEIVVLLESEHVVGNIKVDSIVTVSNFSGLVSSLDSAIDSLIKQGNAFVFDRLGGWLGMLWSGIGWELTVMLIDSLVELTIAEVGLDANGAISTFDIAMIESRFGTWILGRLRFRLDRSRHPRVSDLSRNASMGRNVEFLGVRLTNVRFLEIVLACRIVRARSIFGLATINNQTVTGGIGNLANRHRLGGENSIGTFWGGIERRPAASVRVDQRRRFVLLSVRGQHFD